MMEKVILTTRMESGNPILLQFWLWCFGIEIVIELSRLQLIKQFSGGTVWGRWSVHRQCAPATEPYLTLSLCDIDYIWVISSTMSIV